MTESSFFIYAYLMAIAKKNEWIHPCQKCGACCASYRVSFYWREAESTDREHPVPAGYWEENYPGNGRYRIMKGTNQNHKIKCIALQGRVGEYVSCSIYMNRPTPCDQFKASYEDGLHKPRCDEARAKHGLKPLTKSDWVKETDFDHPNQISNQDLDHQ